MRVQRSWRWLFVILWMLIIFLFSQQAHSGRETEKYLKELNVPVRKMAHVCEYLVLFVLLRWALHPAERKVRDTHVFQGKEQPALLQSGETRSHFLSPYLVAFFITFAYALSDEFHQSFIPGRSSCWGDVFVDTSGAALGWLIWAGASRRKPRNNNC